jgi:Leu/Phe-tRNA-protein transferase
MLLRAYALGIFPMAEDADSSRLHWIEPHFRGVSAAWMSSTSLHQLAQTHPPAGFHRAGRP